MATSIRINTFATWGVVMLKRYLTPVEWPVGWLVWFSGVDHSRTNWLQQFLNMTPSREDTNTDRKAWSKTRDDLSNSRHLHLVETMQTFDWWEESMAYPLYVRVCRSRIKVDERQERELSKWLLLILLESRFRGKPLDSGSGRQTWQGPNEMIPPRPKEWLGVAWVPQCGRTTTHLTCWLYLLTDPLNLQTWTESDAPPVVLNWLQHLAILMSYTCLYLLSIQRTIQETSYVTSSSMKLF